MPGRWSATRRGILIDKRIDVGPESLRVDGCCTGHGSNRSLRHHEPAAPQRHEFPDRHAVARHDEGLAAVDSPRDLAAVVS